MPKIPVKAMMNNNIQLKILRLLLEEGEDISLREVARRLGISSSLTHYHMQKMAGMGILIHRVTGRQMGYYEPQHIFTEYVEVSRAVLTELAKRVEDCNGEKLGNCISFFLKALKTI